MKKFVVLISLAAFILAGILSVLPHTHYGTPGSHPYDCSINRAQSVQPLVAPPVPRSAISLNFFGGVVSVAETHISQHAFLSPSSRAPPLSA